MYDSGSSGTSYVNDSQISDAAVQHCEEALQAVISVTGD